MGFPRQKVKAWLEQSDHGSHLIFRLCSTDVHRGVFLRAEVNHTGEGPISHPDNTGGSTRCRPIVWSIFSQVGIHETKSAKVWKLQLVWFILIIF